MSYFDNLRRLVCDVKNPGFDRRCRYGVNAVKILKEGTRLYEFTRKDEDRFSPGSVYWYKGEHSDSVNTSHGFGALLIENSVVCEPETWRERVRMAVGANVHAEWIIDQLITSGIVTPEQVAQAAIAQDQEDAIAQE